MGLPLLTCVSHRYTLTEGDFHHLKNARLTHLHLPPPALKIVTIHECESSENSLAMTPRLPPPKPGLAIFQVSPQCPRDRWDMGARYPAAPQGGIAVPRVRALLEVEAGGPEVLRCRGPSWSPSLCRPPEHALPCSPLQGPCPGQCSPAMPWAPALPCLGTPTTPLWTPASQRPARLPPPTPGRGLR